MTNPANSSPFAGLLAVASARFDANGQLREANAGFLRLLGEGATQFIGNNVAQYFIQPNFARLAVADGYRGLLTIGTVSGRSRTLRGCTWRDGADVHLLAEADVEGLERLADQMQILNEELNISQRALAQANSALQQREARIVEASLTDALTGIGNRRKLEQALTQEISRARRTGGSLCALMADLDYFKQVNDRHGHGAGDRVLEEFAAMLRAQTRPTDIIARYGGEEFVVLLPHTELDDAAALADRIRRALASRIINPPGEPLTASFGVARLRPEERGDVLLDRADEALYRAKAAGRNRVAVEVPPPAATGVDDAP